MKLLVSTCGSGTATTDWALGNGLWLVLILPILITCSVVESDLVQLEDFVPCIGTGCILMLIDKVKATSAKERIVTHVTR